jgi:hypothetical protein
MTNKEQIQRDIAVITFIDEENTKIEKRSSKFQQKKYVKVKRHFEVL